jgi:opacity protein-like surface antigen
MLKIKLLFAFILLAFITMIMLAPSAYSEDKFYIKGTISAHKTKDIKEYQSIFKSSLKSSSYFSPVFGLGVGYFINDGIRTDLMYEQSKIMFNKESVCVTFADNNITCKGMAYIKRGTDVKSLMLNGYVDILDRDAFKFFVGGGVGIARIKETVNRSIIGKATLTDLSEYDFNYSESTSNKVKNNFAYALILGTTMKLNPGINLELAYSWRDMGVTKHRLLDKCEPIITNEYKGHSFSTGLRFDL